jgi:hypothetical protein
MIFFDFQGDFCPDSSALLSLTCNLAIMVVRSVTCTCFKEPKLNLTGVVISFDRDFKAIVDLRRIWAEDD